MPSELGQLSDGIGLEMKYFVLNPASKEYRDPYAFASRAAMFAYANAIEGTNELLARDLRRWASREEAYNIQVLGKEKPDG